MTSSVGAALVYTSTKENKNIGILHDYLVHKAYGLKFNIPASVLDREAVFIPMGWDSDKRIAVLCEQMKHINAHEPLKNVLVPPRATVPVADTEVVTSEDDQALLLALQAYLSKAPKSSSSVPTGTAGTQKERSPRPSMNSSDSMDAVLGKQVPVPGPGGSGGEQVLAAFFTNLLTKNKPGAGKQLRSSSMQAEVGRSLLDPDNK